MKRYIQYVSILLTSLFFLSSCTSSSEFFKTLKIDTFAKEEQPTAEEKTIKNLKHELSLAKKNETTLNAEILELKNKIEKQEADYTAQLTDLENLFASKEASYHQQIGSLKGKLDQKDALISIQGKVIGLLDDADQSLQKSIEDQLNNR